LGETGQAGALSNPEVPGIVLRLERVIAEDELTGWTTHRDLAIILLREVLACLLRYGVDVIRGLVRDLDKFDT
jgi:hypothetical protein